MEQIINPFNIPIAQDILSKESYLLIKEEVMEYLNKNQNYLDTPWNCPTKTSLHLSPEKSFSSTNVINEIKNITTKYHKEWGFEDSMEFNIYALWVNVSEKEGFQEYHRHPRGIFSGVLYLDVNEDSGDLTLVNPLDGILNYFPLNSKSPLKHSITPQNGLIISFPSFMGHYVGSNKSNKNRISISWNIKSNIKYGAYH
jgi:uncharacterized protein (TIGR02466 family)